MRVVCNIVMLAGLISLDVGCWLVHPAIALIVAGVALVAIGFGTYLRLNAHEEAPEK